MHFIDLSLTVMFFGILTNTISAPVTTQIAYQGILTDNAGNPVSDGEHTLEFDLYADSAGGSSLWTETKKVTTKGGMFSHMLGSVTSLEGLKFDGQ